MLTKDQRADRAEQLLDCMDGINDACVDEARRWRESGGVKSMNADRARRRRRGWIAAAVIAGVLLLNAGRIGNLIRRLDRSAGDDFTLSASLEAALDTNAFTPADRDALDYFDGNIRLCIGDRGTGQVYVSRPLTESERLLLDMEMTDTHADRVERGEGENFNVWILWGNGLVASPCLDNTPGCVGAGALFDYADERVPTDAFRKLLQTFAKT